MVVINHINNLLNEEGKDIVNLGNNCEEDFAYQPDNQAASRDASGGLAGGLGRPHGRPWEASRVPIDSIDSCVLWWALFLCLAPDQHWHRSKPAPTNRNGDTHNKHG